mgnify:CR=1 FL=1
MRIARLVPTAALATLLPAIFLASAVHAADPNQVPPPPAMAARAYLLVKHGNTAAALQSYAHALTLTPHAAQRQHLQKQIDLLHI